MSLDKIPIISKSKRFCVTKSPDNTAICFMFESEDGSAILNALVSDCGDHFAFATIEPDGIKITEFNPKNRLMLKSGLPAELCTDRQIEVDTPFGRQIQVRYLYANERPSGVIVACREGDFLRSLMLAGEKDGFLCFCLSE